MDWFRRSAKYVSIVLTIVSCLIYLPVQSVFAAMVDTQQLPGMNEMQSARDKVHVFLQRQDVQNILIARGIDPLEAAARVNSLSDREIQQVADQIDRLPEGGGLLGALVLITLVSFVVLVILDATGVTDVLTFVHPPQK